MSCFQGRLTPEIKVSALFALLDYLTLCGVLRSGEGFQTVFTYNRCFCRFVIVMKCRGMRTEIEGKGREENCLREDEEETL